MAVPKKKMIERFRALFPKVNLSKERLNTLMDKLSQKPEDDSEDSAIDQILNDYNDILSFEDIAKEDDKSRKLASDKAKLEAAAARKQKGGDNNGEDDEDDDLDDPETPEWAKKLMKENRELKESVQNIQNGKVADTKFQQAQKLFTESDVLKGMKPELQEKWLKRIQLDSEVSLEDQVEELATEYSDLVQVNADTSSFAPGAGGGKAKTEADQEKVDNVLDKMNV